MFLFKRLSLKYRLMVSFVLTASLAMVGTGLLTWHKKTTTLMKLAEERLMIFRESKGLQLEEAFKTMRGQVRTLAKNRLTIEAMKDFSKSFLSYQTELTEVPSDDRIKSAITSYYSNQFGEEYRKQNDEVSPDTSGIIPKLSSTALILQFNYIIKNEHPLGSKNLLTKFNDGTTWSEFHNKYHESFAQYLNEFGYYDIFLVEPGNADVVYSVFKELDFATSLRSGPFRNSNFAKTVLKAFSTAKGDVVLSDLEPYFPSYQNPAGFIASPIFEDDKMIGAMVFQIPVEKIDAIITNKFRWREEGMGDSGESYIIGNDFKMRSTSRFLVEDPEGYFNLVRNSGMEAKDMSYIRSKKTTTLAQTVDSLGAKSAVAGRTGFAIFPDYRGTEVLSSYRPLKIDGLQWSILSEFDREEILRPARDLAKILIYITTGAILLIALLALFLTSGISKKIVSYVYGLEKASKTTLDNSSNLSVASKRVSSSATEQATAIQETVSTLNEISAMGERSVKFASQSTEKAENSFKLAKEGQKAVTEMSKSMNEISESNRQIMRAVEESNRDIKGIVEIIQSIAQKTTVINEIVFQTKLLSFNASVEAARAGEHGKGFAVVAEEVGNLAQMSGNSSKEISDLLEESVAKVGSVVEKTSREVSALIESGSVKIESGASIARRCGEVLVEVVENVDEVKSAMGEITIGAKEIADGVANISSAMNELDQATHANSDIAAKTSRYSSELGEQARVLDQIVKGLRETVFGVGRSDTSEEWNNKQLPDIKNVVPIKDSHAKSHSKKGDSSGTEPAMIKKAVGESAVPAENDPRFEEV